MVGCFTFFKRTPKAAAEKGQVVSTFEQRGGSHHMEEELSAVLPAYTPRALATEDDRKHDLPQNLKDLAKTIDSTVFDISDELRRLSLKMFELKELKFKEFKTHDLFCDWFDDKYKPKGWKVTRHAHDMETAFRMEFEHRPKGHTGELKSIMYNSELDALPGIGHGCGHPLIAISGIAGAIGTAEALVKHDLPGKVVLLGTPAEEGGGGKNILLKNGAYKGMDCCLMAHPTPESSIGNTLAVTAFTVTYYGKAAHAAAFPWEGVNALDAAVQAYVNIATLRQQVPPSHRLQGVIKGEDWSRNVIPDKAIYEFNVRAPTKAELDAVVPRVRHCFEAAAISSGCKVEIETEIVYLDLKNSSPMAETYRQIMGSYYGDLPSTQNVDGSTDFGDVTYAMPAIHPFFSIPLPSGGSNHTREFEKDARSEAAHKKTLQVGVALALTGTKFIVDEDYAREVTTKWQDWKKGRRSLP